MSQPVHHSIADWDKSNTNFSLFPGNYTSPPTSLRATASPYPIFLCNHPSTLCIPEGRILCQTWHDIDRASMCNFMFRNQLPLDNIPDYRNCYMVEILQPNIMLYEWVDGLLTWSHTYGYWPPGDKWVNIEITWWNYPVYDDKHPLAVQVRAYYDHDWHDHGRAEREIGRWHDSPINRVGFGLLYNDNYIDDTEIHSPVWPPPEVKLIYTAIYSSTWLSNPFGLWVEWDLSAIIPAHATVVEVGCSAVINNVVGCRTLGSPINRIFVAGAATVATSLTIQCEVGPERKIETYRQNNTDVWFVIAGYWTSE